MSQIQTAFVEKSLVPDRARLEQAIGDLGFDLTIDEIYRPFDCSGFLPCVLKGRKSGFEIYFESLNEALRSFPRLKDEIGSRDCAINFRWGGDLAECACVLVVSAALAKSFGAVVHYQGNDLLYSTDQLVGDARSALHASESEFSPDPSAPLPQQKKPWWRIW